MSLDVTGKMILRDKGDAPDGSGRKLVMVMGVIAIPAESKAAEYAENGDTVYIVQGTDVSLLSLQPIGNLDKDFGTADHVFTGYKWQV